MQLIEKSERIDRSERSSWSETIINKVGQNKLLCAVIMPMYNWHLIAAGISAMLTDDGPHYLLAF